MPVLTKVSYQHLNARQQENYNFQKVSAILADYGYVTHRLTDDWQGADFIAQHINSQDFLKVQLKGRLTLDKKYQGKGIYVCFPYRGQWYLYEHDVVCNHLLGTTKIGKTTSWLAGNYSNGRLSAKMLQYLQSNVL